MPHGWDEGALCCGVLSHGGENYTLAMTCGTRTLIMSPLIVKLQVGGIATASICSTLAVQVNLVPGN